VIARAPKKTSNDVPAPGAAAQHNAHLAPLARSPPVKTYPCARRRGKTYERLIG
jgi:hypothetical protein